jgi:hypothetical protein
MPDEFVKVWRKNPDHEIVSKQLRDAGYDISPDAVLCCVFALRIFGVHVETPLIMRKKTRLDHNEADDTQQPGSSSP